MNKLNGAKHAATNGSGRARHAKPSYGRKYILGGVGLALCLAISVPFVISSVSPANSFVELAAVESATTGSNNTDNAQSASAKLPVASENAEDAQGTAAETDGQEAPQADLAEQAGQDAQDGESVQDGQAASEPQDSQFEPDSFDDAVDADSLEADAADQGSVFDQAQALVQGGQPIYISAQENSPEGVEPDSDVQGGPEGVDAGAADSQALDAFTDKAKIAQTDAYSDAFAEDISFFSTVIEDGSPVDSSAAYELGTKAVTHTQGVAETLQEGVLDTGCEIISLSVALRSMGVEADPVDIANRYLDMNGNFADGYVGNPYSGGGGFPVGIVRTANAYLADARPDLHAHDLTGNSFDTLVGLVQHGYPVLVWTTTDFKEPYKSGTFQDGYEWYLNEHCVVLCGVSGENVLVNDSLEGLVERDTAQFADIFEKCGSMAMYVR